jgi:hypothetical protein
MNEVVIKDIQMPFMSMVTFMVKWAFAAIPAIIIIAVIATFLMMIAGAVLTDIGVSL